MHLTSVTRTFALAISGIVLLSAYAKADNFNFSITNTIGNVAGTVTGEILGLTNNSTGPASEVIIESYPVALISDFGNAPIIATLWNDQFENTFTETGGVITAENFWAEDVGGPPFAVLFINGDPEAGLLFNGRLPGQGFNLLSLDGYQDLVYGPFGISGANITPAGGRCPSHPRLSQQRFSAHSWRENELASDFA